MKYYIIAGEASGDLHGSNLMKGILALDKNAEIRFWGGAMMASAGGEMVRDYAAGAVMGITDIISKAGMLLGNLKFCKSDILRWNPDVVILIDYPGFNFKIAEFAHKRGFRVFYYIAPKTWASREKRNLKLKKFVDRLYIVFPFEIPYFTSKGIDFIYKGNPLVDAVDNARMQCPYDGDYIAVLAGSRKGEISRMMPVCIDVALKMHAMPQYAGYKFIVAGAPSRSENDYLPYMAGCEDFVKLVFGRTYDVLKYARSAIINSGTASLEAALIGTPQLVAWSTSPLTAFIARKILKVNVKYISLGNLIIDKYAFREFVQEDFTTENILDETRRLIEDESYRNTMIEDYAKMRAALGGTGASEAVAASMIEELSIKRTCLYGRHLALGAKMSPFGGFDMPIQYSSIINEHNAVRSKAGLFDVSHMGEIFVEGPGAKAYVNSVFTNDITDMSKGKILYGMMCYPDGGVVDDLLVYYMGGTRYLLVVNAANIEKDYGWLTEHIGKFDCKVVNESGDWGQVALQGPESERIVKEILGIQSACELGFYTFSQFDYKGCPMILSRTGYTGEDGFEIYTTPQMTVKIWDRLLESGVEPCGLGCRDTLRFEAGLPLYGHELSPQISPVVAGLSMFCKFDKDFIGRDALYAQKQNGAPKKLVGIELQENAVPRAEYPVELEDGTVVGVVTTGYRSISLSRSVCFALVDSECAALGTTLMIRIRKKVFRGNVVKKRFYNTNYKK